MKKVLIALLVTAAVFFSLVFTIGTLSVNREDEFKVAMVTDFSDDRRDALVDDFRCIKSVL